MTGTLTQSEKLADEAIPTACPLTEVDAQSALMLIEMFWGPAAARLALTRLGAGNLASLPVWGYSELVRFTYMKVDNLQEFSAAIWAESIEFLEKLRPSGPWLLTAISPDRCPGVKSTETRLTQNHSDLCEFLGANNGKRNIYYSPNPTRGTNKAAKTDITGIEFILADLDPNSNEASAAAKERYLKQFASGAGQPYPTMILDSGNGIQTLWRLKDPICLRAPTQDAENKELEFSQEDAAKIKDVEARSAAIMRQLGAKAGTQNIDRILRLPGTINLPNAKKSKEGRIACPTKLIDFNDGVHALEAFQLPEIENRSCGSKEPTGQVGQLSTFDFKSLPEVDIDALPISYKIKGLIRTGDSAAHGYPSRSEAVIAVLCAMARAGCRDEQMASIMSFEPIGEHVREQSSPITCLRRQIKRAREFVAPADATIEFGQIDPAVAEVNKTYALIIVGGRSAILKENGADGIEFWNVYTFEQYFAKKHVRCGEKKIPLAKYWLTSEQRRDYEALVFAPGGCDPRYYNLWRGFAVERRSGTCSKLLDHIKNNVCRGDLDLFNWVVGWFAQIMQRPDEKVGTALVLRGKQGTGKTIIGKCFGALLGGHYTLVADPRYITGQFNSHLVACLLLHADEGFWAGDRAAEGKLKDLITGDQHFIEYKGKDSITAKNYVRLLVTGNHDWQVPAGYEERRFAVFDVCEDHMQDHAYFAAIGEEMNAGGREALLDYLLSFDLTKVDLRTIPKTAALLEQKVATLTGERGWWLDVLMRGELPWGCVEPNSCPACGLFDSYIAHASKTGNRRRSIETQIGAFVSKMAPGLTRRKGHYNIKRSLHSYTTEERGLIYEFPPLAECRATFEKMLQQSFSWTEQGDWQIEGSVNGCPTSGTGDPDEFRPIEASTAGDLFRADLPVKVDKR